MKLSVFLRNFDWALLAIVAAILLCGTMTFYAMLPESANTLSRHIIFTFIGMATMIAISFIDYRIFKNSVVPVLLVYILSIVLLSLALASHEIRGSSAWLRFFGFQFEPSELTKLALLIIFAKYFSQKHVEIYRTHHIIISAIYLVIPLVLTLLQPDMGSVIVYVAIWISMLFFSGIKRKHLLAIGMIGLLFASTGWLFVLKPYQKDRIISFLDPYVDPSGRGYHSIQSQTTLGSGQIFGTYFTNNKDIPVMVPEPYTDFTFSAFSQKFGFVGNMFLFILFTLLILRVCQIAQRSTNNFAKLFSLGFAMIIITHIIINGGMNMGIMPITGIPFPFLSHGGSHMVTLMAGLGILESIKMRSS